jgi:hypothetical protein
MTRRRRHAPTVKVCKCGRSYTRAQWRKLPDAKRWDFDGELCEMRRCACGSHIAIVIKPAP